MRRTPGADFDHDDAADRPLSSGSSLRGRRRAIWHRRHLLWSLVVGLSVSCHGDPAPAFTSTTSGVPGSTGVQTTTGVMSSTSLSSTTHADSALASSSSSSSTGGGATTLVTDVGWDSSSSNGTTPAGCKGKIDFLFVVSNSTWMISFQEQLIAAFPAFIEMIEATFEDFDYHIMVVDSDAKWGLDVCTSACPDLTCKKGDPCCPDMSNPGELCCPAEVQDYPCTLLDMVTACDHTLGAGVTFPAGGLASNEPCKLAGGRRYMTSGQPDLAEVFACVAKVGATGDINQAASLVAALQPTINSPGGCNDGFLRDDALLMVTIINSGNGDDSAGGPGLWYEQIVAAKNGDPNAVVMLDIGQGTCPWWDLTCELSGMFPHHIHGDNDDPDYGHLFTEATALVEVACEELIPQ